MHAPHLMSSWVTDSPGVFDPRPRSLRFRFVTAMAGVLGLGADLSRWTPAQHAEAASLISVYKQIRDVIHHGTARVLAGPSAPTAATQYTAEDGDTVVVLAWSTGSLTGAPLVPGRSSRVRLDVCPNSSYVDETGARYSGSHLKYAGLPFDWTAEHDADVVVLRRLE
jgi:alpha-galactosidase